jgi:hypothetical protein
VLMHAFDAPERVRLDAEVEVQRGGFRVSVKLRVAVVATMATLAFATAAQAAQHQTLTVGPAKSCPGADYAKIQKAIDAANAGDTIDVCAGTFTEGKGKQGTNALTIDKNLTLVGAGADQTIVKPKATNGGRLAGSSPNLRSGTGDILAAVGTPTAPITVKVSGITFDAAGVDVTAGIAFVDAQGSIGHVHVTGVDIDESATGYQKPGGFRNDSAGDGIVDVTAAMPSAKAPKAPPVRTLTIDHTRVDKYNAIGVLIDSATGDYSPYIQPSAPLAPSGIVNHAILTNDVIAGRNLCQNYNDPTAGGPTVIDGDCEATSGNPPIPPPLPLTTGPLFGQDGVRVTAGASVEMVGDTVSSNLVNGSGSPVQSVFAPTPNNDPYLLGNHAENNQNLRLGSGVRLIGAGTSTISQNNITDNAFGLLNTTLDGTTNNSAAPVAAQNDWWGLRTGAVTLPTPGPAVWPNIVSPPATTPNPPVPENPVNGSPVADSSCAGAGVSDSDSVTFCPYRSSDQSDTVQGEFPVAETGASTATPASCTSNVGYDPNIPTYDSFFSSTLGSGVTGDGLSGANPSAKQAEALDAYAAAVVAAINANPTSSGARVAAKIVQMGTTELGRPYHYVAIGTPANLANLDGGRNDAAFWRGVISGDTDPDTALAQIGRRPGIGWIAEAPHGNEPAGGEATVKELYELAARTDCDNAKRLANLDLFLVPDRTPDDRDANVRTTAFAFDPNRDLGTYELPESKSVVAAITQYPGLFYIDAHQQTSGYFFPPDQDAALNEISHAALNEIQDDIGPAIQQAFNDQTGQYRNYNEYDLFVPEYGDTVPSLLMGGAGMTYEKGNNENYGKQVYDHYLAIDATVNIVAERKDALMQAWVDQWPEAVKQGQQCEVQENTQVSPPAVDQYEIGQPDISQNPNVDVCGYYYLPGAHSGDVAQTIKDLEAVGVDVYRLDKAVTVKAAHPFGDFDINMVQGQGSPALTTALTLPAGTLYIPMAQGRKHWIQGLLGENPFLPFNYFYDEVTWSDSLLRGFSGDGFLTQKLPGKATMTQVADPGLGTIPQSPHTVYAFNTDSMAGLAMANDLLEQGATVARAATSFDSTGVHFASGAALVDGASIALGTLNQDATTRETPVYGLTGYPVSHYALKAPKIALYAGTSVPTNPLQKGTGSGECGSVSSGTNYCEALFTLTQKDAIPASEITGVTTADLTAGALTSGAYTVLIDPAASITGAAATALQSFINAGGVYVGDATGGTTSARNAGVTALNTNTVSGISTPGSTFDATWNTSDPEAWGFDSGGWIYREASSDPNYDPATLNGNGTTIGAAEAAATYAPAGDCGGPAGFGNCYGYEINANANLPGRPVVVDQPFGSGHAIMLGFDPYYRAWVTEEERLVLNGILYPTGTAIPPTPAAGEAVLTAVHAGAATAAIAKADLPLVERRPLKPSGSTGADVMIGVNRADAAALRGAVRAARLPGRIRARLRYATRRNMYELVIAGVRNGDVEQRGGWESQLLATISAHRVKLLLGQV